MTRVPLRGRLSLLRQRAILVVRYWFRLPIDQLREEKYERETKAIFEGQRTLADAVATLTGLASDLDARLRWYESRMPALRKEYKAFIKEQQKRAKVRQVREAAPG